MADQTVWDCPVCGRENQVSRDRCGRCGRFRVIHAGPHQIPVRLRETGMLFSMATHETPPVRCEKNRHSGGTNG